MRGQRGGRTRPDVEGGEVEEAWRANETDYSVVSAEDEHVQMWREVRLKRLERLRRPRGEMK